MYYRAQRLHGADIFADLSAGYAGTFLHLIELFEVFFAFRFVVEEFPRDIHGGENGDFQFFPGCDAGLYFFHLAVNVLCDLFCRFDIDITFD